VAAAYAGIGARAVLDVPLVKGGRMAAMLFIDHPSRAPGPGRRGGGRGDLRAAVGRSGAAHAEERLREGEARWRGLFERMQRPGGSVNWSTGRTGGPPTSTTST
jgi:hypothetical protein